MARKVGREFASAMIPSCVERGPMVRDQPAGRRVYPWHSEAVLADTPPEQQPHTPTSAALLQHTVPALPKFP